MRRENEYALFTTGDMVKCLVNCTHCGINYLNNDRLIDDGYEFDDLESGHANLITCSMDPTDPIFTLHACAQEVK